MRHCITPVHDMSLPALLDLKKPGANAAGISDASKLNLVFVQSMLPKSPIPNRASIQCQGMFNACGAKAWNSIHYWQEAGIPWDNLLDRLQLLNEEEREYWQISWHPSCTAYENVDRDKSSRDLQALAWVEHVCHPDRKGRHEEGICSL